MSESDQKGMKLKTVFVRQAMAALKVHDISIDDHLKRTAQDSLPQARALSELVKHLEQKAAVSEIYLKGSFAAGEADASSDLDVFLVVSPDGFEEIFNEINSFLQKKYPAVIFCNHRPLRDYGGVGFMFLCKPQVSDKLILLDLYIAAEGVPLQVKLTNSPRVYARNPDNCHIIQESEQKKSLPTDTADFIKRFLFLQTQDEELTHYFSSFLTNIHIMQKRLNRGQIFRALDTENELYYTGACMLRIIAGDTNFQTTMFAIDKLIARERHTPALAAHIRRFEELTKMPLDERKVAAFHNFARSLIEQCAPQILRANRNLDIEYKSYFNCKPAKPSWAV